MAAETFIFYGPPGCGKTHRLMEVLKDEINNYNTDVKKIAFVTFTKKGAEEGKSRAAELLGVTERQLPNFCTLHSFAFKRAGINKQLIMDNKKYLDFSRKIGMDFAGYYSHGQGEDDKYLEFIDMYRNNRKAAQDLIGYLDMNKALWVMRQYKNYKDTFRYKDFTDLIEQYNGCEDLDVAIIDEAQDLTTLQWRMALKAFSNCKRIYIAGDDDQAIYQWSGADVDIFLHLNGKSEILSQSYRLPNNFVDYSKTIVHNIKNRIEKEYKGREDAGLITRVNNLQEILLHQDETYLCLARNNAFLQYYIDWLNTKKVPYLLKGESIYSQKDLEAIIEWEKIRKTMQMDKGQEYRFSRIRKQNTLLSDNWYDVFDWKQDKIDYIRSMIGTKQINKKPLINISTIHTVKGGEAQNVIILPDITKKVKEQLDTMPDSEHRVFYVGITRASKRLYIVKPQTAIYYDYL